MDVAIEIDFRECIEFFFPIAATEIDWKGRYNFLDWDAPQFPIANFVFLINANNSQSQT